MSKVMILCSSPRKHGNTNTLAKWVAEAVRAEGHTCEMVDVAKLNYKTIGCTACMHCQQSEKFECAIDDEATPILASLADYDCVVLASPVYFMALNAQMRVFMDRMFSLFKIRENYETPLQGKVMGLIATAGGDMDNSGLPLVKQHVEILAQFSNCRFESLLLPSAPFNPVELKNNEKLQEKAKAFAKKLV